MAHVHVNLPAFAIEGFPVTLAVPGKVPIIVCRTGATVTPEPNRMHKKSKPT